MSAKITSPGKKWLIRLYNAGKISGNLVALIAAIIAYLLVLRLFYLSCGQSGDDIFLGSKKLYMSKNIFYPLYGSILIFYSVVGYFLFINTFKIFSIAKHLLYWLTGFLFLIIFQCAIIFVG